LIPSQIRPKIKSADAALTQTFSNQRNYTHTFFAIYHTFLTSAYDATSAFHFLVDDHISILVSRIHRNLS
jgi:hypothetical protein